MHSDVAVEVAYSGEFFVRALHRDGQVDIHSHTDQGGDASTRGDESNEQARDSSPSPHTEDPDEDPSHYELVIDNDSGTYRPRSDLLPLLRAWLAAPQNLGALGRVTAVDAFDENQKRWKEERKKLKEEESGGKKGGKRKQVQRQVSVSPGSSTSSSVSGMSGVIEPSGGGGKAEQVRVTKEDMLKAVEEDAKRARENDDRDPGAKEEVKMQEQAGTSDSRAAG